METNILVNADCMDFMPTLPSGSVDLVFTSPPYNLGGKKTGGGNRGNRPIEYGVYKDDMPPEEYKKWQHEVLTECYRVLKDDGAIFYNHKPRVMNKVYDDRRGLIPFDVRQVIVWDTAKMINFEGSFFAPRTERIFVITKGDSWRVQEGYQSFSDLWQIPSKPNADHPATFPLELATRVIASACPEGALVYDPFSGTGTVALAAYKLGRQYIGTELDPKYHAIAEKRLAEEKMQSRFF